MAKQMKNISSSIVFLLIASVFVAAKGTRLLFVPNMESLFYRPGLMHPNLDTTIAVGESVPTPAPTPAPGPNLGQLAPSPASRGRRLQSATPATPIDNGHKQQQSVPSAGNQAGHKAQTLAPNTGEGHKVQEHTVQGLAPLGAGGDKAQSLAPGLVGGHKSHPSATAPSPSMGQKLKNVVESLFHRSSKSNNITPAPSPQQFFHRPHLFDSKNEEGRD